MCTPVVTLHVANVEEWYPYLFLSVIARLAIKLDQLSISLELYKAPVVIVG